MERIEVNVQTGEVTTVSLTAEMTAYRQALRDLPANTTDPANPVWPVKPNPA